MAITGELLDSGSQTALSVSTQLTNVITAGSGAGQAKPFKLICIDIWSGTAQNVTSVTGLGLTWIRQAGLNDRSITAATSTTVRWYAVGTTAAPPTTGAITINWGGNADSSMWIVTQFDDVDTRNGASGIGIFPQGSGAENGNDDNYDITLGGALASSRNAALVSLARSVADAPTIDADFTSLAVTTVTALDGSLSVAYAINQTVCSITSTTADYAWSIYEVVANPLATAAGTSTATSTGASSIAEATGTSAGSSTAAAEAIPESVGTSNGTSTADAVGSTTSVGTAAGTSTADAVGQTGLNADGSSAGVATADAVGASIAAATGTADGVATATAEGVTAAIGAGSSSGTATADGAGIPPSDGTSDGFALVGAEGCGPGAGLSEGTSTADAVGVAQVRADGLSDGTSTADGFSIVNIAGVGSAAGVATVTGVARPPSDGAANGVATANAFALVTTVGVGNAAGVATVLGVSLTTVVDVESVDVIAADMLELVFNQPLLVNAAMEDLDTYRVFHDGAGYPVTIKDVIIPAGRTTSSVRLVITPFTIGESYFVIVAKDVLKAPSGDILTTDNAAEFIGRETKVDRIISNRPAFYDMAPRAVIRCLFDAIGREDDLIGGFRHDQIRRSVDSLSILPPTVVESFGFAQGLATVTGVAPESPVWFASGPGVSAVDVPTSAAWPAGTQNNDIGLLIVSALPQNMWLDYPSFQHFMWLAEAENGTGHAQFLYWCRATTAVMNANGGNMPNVVVAGSSLNTDHRVAQIHVFRNCHSTGFPWDNVATAIAASSSSFSCPSITTLGTARLLVGVAGSGRDVDSTTEFTFNEGDVTERGDFMASVGGGGGFGVATRVKATAGTLNPSFTGTMVGASTQVNHAIALKGPGVEPTRQTPTPRLLTSGSFDPSAGASATTATITAGSGPTEFHTNEVCYCDVNIYSRSPIGSAITVTGCGVTWVQENEVTALIGTSGYLGRFRAIGTPTTGALTITVVSGTATLFLWVVHQWAGIDTGAALQVNSTTTSTDNLNPQVIGTTAVLENAKNAAVVCTGKGTTTTSDIIIDPAFTLIGTAQETGTSDGIMRVYYALGRPRAYTDCGVVSTHSLISELKSAT